MLLNCQTDNDVPSSHYLRNNISFPADKPRKIEHLKLKAQIKIDGRVRFRRNFNLWAAQKKKKKKFTIICSCSRGLSAKGWSKVQDSFCYVRQ